MQICWLFPSAVWLGLTCSGCTGGEDRVAGAAVVGFLLTLLGRVAHPSAALTNATGRTRPSGRQSPGLQRLFHCSARRSSANPGEALNRQGGGAFQSDRQQPAAFDRASVDVDRAGAALTGVQPIWVPVRSSLSRRNSDTRCCAGCRFGHIRSGKFVHALFQSVETPLDPPRKQPWRTFCAVRGHRSRLPTSCPKSYAASTMRRRVNPAQLSSSSRSAASSTAISAGLVPGPPAKCPHTVSIVRSSAFGMWATSNSLSAGGK
jgi:hypothetical protein